MKSNLPVYGIAVLISLTAIFNLFGILPIWNDLTLRAYEKYTRDDHITGIHIPVNAIRQHPTFTFIKGRHHFAIDMNSSSIAFRLPRVVPDSGKIPLDVTLHFKNNSLLLTYDLYDYNGVYLGRIDNEKWGLNKSKIFDYHDDDSTIEVRDNAGNVVFGLAYRSPNYLILSGYSTNPCTCAVFDTATTIYLLNLVNCREPLKKFARQVRSYRVGAAKSDTWSVVVTMGMIMGVWGVALWYRRS